MKRSKRSTLLCFVLCFIVVMACFVPVSVSVACRNPGQHFSNSKYKNSNRAKVTKTVKITERTGGGTYEYKYIQNTSKKWVCGYAKTADKDGVYLRKGASVHWAPTSKKVPTATLSVSPSYGDFSLGGISVEIPLGKVGSESSITQEVGPVKKTGIYKVYVHRFYEVKSVSVMARKYNTQTRKWGKWYVKTKSCMKTTTPIISKPVLVLQK